MKEITSHQLKQRLTQLPPVQLVDDIIDLYFKIAARKLCTTKKP